MSQPAVAALSSLPFELVYSDGEPLENNWHRLQMNLFIDLIYQAMTERGRSDFFAGGDMFVYYSYEQAKDIVSGRPYFRGPDVFFVDGVRAGRSQGLGRLGRGGTTARPHRGAALPLDGEHRPHREEGSLLPRLPHLGVLPLRSGDLPARRLPSGGKHLRSSAPQLPGAGSGASGSGWSSASGRASRASRPSPRTRGCGSSIRMAVWRRRPPKPSASWRKPSAAGRTSSASGRMPNAPEPMRRRPSWPGCGRDWRGLIEAPELYGVQAYLRVSENSAGFLR